MRRRGKDLGEFLMVYRFGLEELLTKVNILREETTLRHGSSPIEHVSSRLKSIDSLVAKAERLGCALTSDALADSIFDIAGVRVVTSFVSDCYDVMEMLTSQPDVTVREVEDYIAEPKMNGYRSLHMLVEIPVFLSDRVVPACVEVQIRTVAMDFWASLEHKIYYKYDGAVPDSLRDELAEAADTASDLDQQMMRLHRKVHGTQH
ncbi:MAG: GTP pyrophosphokinase [Nocardioides sp.]|nr:GTP pyrophosphokinase [Nocardioides sp.]